MRPALLAGLFAWQLGVAQVHSAKRSFGAGVAAIAGSSGYGIRLEANLYYSIKKNAVRLGALFQPQKTNLSGLSLRWNHTLINRDHKHKLELLSFIDVMYNWKVYLSGRVLAREATVNAPSRFNAENYAFASLEFAGGACLNWYIAGRLQWLNGAGLGMYQTLNHPGNMYYDPGGVGPFIRSEVIVRLSR